MSSFIGDIGTPALRPTKSAHSGNSKEHSENKPNASTRANSENVALSESKNILLPSPPSSASTPVVTRVSASPEAARVLFDEAEETTEERLAREARETEALVWQLMREEQENAYRLQMEFASQISDQLSEEDLRAVQAAISEGIAVPAAHEDAGDSEEEDEEEEEEELDVDNMDYDQLLELGEAIGDVKKERWRLKAARVIGELRTATFAALDEGDRKRLRLEDKCAVCMDPFEAEDQLKILPCQHGFHALCADGWLADNDTCPLCKQSILARPPAPPACCTSTEKEEQH